MARLIDLWDPIARKLIGIRPIAQDSAFGYVIRRYPSRSLTGSDGATLTKGERVIELHLDSRVVEAKTAQMSAHQRVLLLRRELLAALKVLGQMVKTDPALADVRGVWGLTLFHRGVEHVGFTVIDLPPSFARKLSSYYLKWLLAAYHPDHQERLHQREEELVPKEIFMSREILVQRYGEERRRDRQPQEGVSE